MNPLLKKPSAWLPIVMSLTVLAMMFFFFTTSEWVHEKDEGVGAHLFQILVGGQIPIIAFFVLKWLPQSPKQTLQILALQIFLVIVTCAPVFLLKL